MVKSGLSSGAGGGIFSIEPKDEKNDGLYAQLKIDGELKKVEITGGLVSDATPKVKGIVHLAEDREKVKGKAVQANDSRLAGATTKRAGIVQFATSGEHSPSKAIQANDTRLKNLQNIKKGMIDFTGDGEEMLFKTEHGCDSPQPITVVVSPMSPDAVGAFFSWDEKNIYFKFLNRPPKDALLKFSWITL